ncbi:MAG: hypothetical protein JXQ30_05625 [Spirochaetes bacterium]|nr:hypothetical protein [Spirochaetota bacterium]
MILAIGNVGSMSLKTKIIEIEESGRATFLKEASLDRIKKRVPPPSCAGR